eukprot:2189257-Prymnesium_polylepis.1
MSLFEESCNGVRSVLMVRVALGACFDFGSETAHFLARPPVKESTELQLYDSVTGTQGNLADLPTAGGEEAEKPAVSTFLTLLQERFPNTQMPALPAYVKEQGSVFGRQYVVFGDAVLPVLVVRYKDATTSATATRSAAAAFDPASLQASVATPEAAAYEMPSLQTLTPASMEAPAVAPISAASGVPALKASIVSGAAKPGPERASLTSDAVGNIIKTLLNLNQLPDEDANLKSLGLDSKNLLVARRMVQKQTGMKLSLAQLLEGRITVRRIIENCSGGTQPLARVEPPLAPRQDAQQTHLGDTASSLTSHTTDQPSAQFNGVIEYDETWSQDATIASNVAKAAATHPNAVALIDAGGPAITYKELLEKVATAAAMLRSRHHVQHDVVVPLRVPPG